MSDSGHALWVARHAPVLASGRCYGRADVPVAVAHDEAARMLARTYPGALPALVWSSPLVRCRAVAERLAAHWGVALSIDDALYEIDFGAWEGREWDEIAANAPAGVAAWSADWLSVAPPGGECARDLETRVRAWWSRLPRSITHVLVAHGGVIRALRVIARHEPWHDAMTREVVHLAWVQHAFDAADH